MASNGDVIAAEAAAAAISSSTTSSAAAGAGASISRAAAGAAAAAVVELKGSGWQALVAEQGVRSIRVLQEDEFNPEVGVMCEIVGDFTMVACGVGCGVEEGVRRGVNNQLQTVWAAEALLLRTSI